MVSRCNRHPLTGPETREWFLHWQVAFPGVWHGWQDASPRGGFDAVIGNPPWGRIKLQEVEWFATRKPELALAPTAAARRAGIRQLRADGDPLVEDFDDAKDRVDTMGQFVRGVRHEVVRAGPRLRRRTVRLGR